MAKSPDELFDYLASLDIDVETVSHPALFTVAQSQTLRGRIAGGHTKNLFLKDRKDSYFLLTLEEEAVVDLKTIHTMIGASGRVSFGRPDMLMELLGVAPGAVTVFGLVNDTQGRVRPFIDATLMTHDIINAHPLTNEATTSIRRPDLLRFIEATGHEAGILKLAA